VKKTGNAAAILKLPLSKYILLLLYSEERNHQIKEYETAGHVVRVGEINVHRELVEKHELKRPLGRPRHRWEDNIKSF
jgi:hypothetical protein